MLHRMKSRRAQALAMLGIGAIAAVAALPVGAQADGADTVRVQDQIPALNRASTAELSTQEFSQLHGTADARYELASRGDGRVLVDNDQIGRVVIVPTRDGAGWCAQFSGAHITMQAPTVTTKCRKVAADREITWSLGVTPLSYSVYGLATADVTDVTIRTEAGSEDAAALTNGAYRWSTTNTKDQPVQIKVTAKGRTSVFDIPVTPIPA